MEKNGKKWKEIGVKWRKREKQEKNEEIGEKWRKMERNGKKWTEME